MSSPTLEPLARMAAVDAGRGYMMLLQIAQPLLLSGVVPLVTPAPLRAFLAHHLDHSAWHGATYLDLGLPGYIVVLGISLHFALRRARRELRVGWQLWRPIVTRALLLFALGIVCNGGLAQPWPQVRIAGVLQRLAVCYAAGCLVDWYCGVRAQLALVVLLLGGYWGLMQWMPFPGMTEDRYGGLDNLAVYLDRAYLPGAGLYGDWDPEGLLTTFPALATCIAGMLFGRLLLVPLSVRRRALWLLGLGLSGLALGKLWALWFPINKYMWTSSFVVVAFGAVVLHVLVLWLLADVWGKHRALFPLIVYGRHSLAAYVSDQLVDFEWIALTLVGGSVALWLGRGSGLALACTVVALQWTLLFWLDRQRRPAVSAPCVAQRTRD